MSELFLNFSCPNKVSVTFGTATVEEQSFTPPITTNDKSDIRWYLEVYGGGYTTEVDDVRATSISSKLKMWGQQLFESVFYDNALSIFWNFQSQDSSEKVITVQTECAQILALPWELLCSPEGMFLFQIQPQISLRRGLPSSQQTVSSLDVSAKEKLRLLFIVSRPDSVGFLDPRAEPMAVMDAIEAKAKGNIEVEFLKQATLEALITRLEDASLPSIDILHFDGHGAFDPSEDLGFLLFTLPNSNLSATKKPHHLVPAEILAPHLKKAKIALIVLSACQSAKISGEEAFGSVAIGLISNGIPAVLAMSYSVLVETTRQLFRSFYSQLGAGNTVGKALEQARKNLFTVQWRREVVRIDERYQLSLSDWFIPTLYQQNEITPLLTIQSDQVSEPASTSSEALPKVFLGRARELWEIEQAFAIGVGHITIKGILGQGKTYLAKEAAHWLCRTGMFEQFFIVDYSTYEETGDTVISHLMKSLNEVNEQLDVNAPQIPHAFRSSTLLLLDQLDVLARTDLEELLTVVCGWSSLGACKILSTTRFSKIEHPEFLGESKKNISILLSGLSTRDACNYFYEVSNSYRSTAQKFISREQLEIHLREIDFHPLLIREFASEFAKGSALDFEDWKRHLYSEPFQTHFQDSINKCFNELKAKSKQLVQKLGVFRNGAFESELLTIIGLGLPEMGEPKALQDLFKIIRSNDYNVRIKILSFLGQEVPKVEKIEAALMERIDNEIARVAKKVDTLEVFLPEEKDDELWPEIRNSLQKNGLITIKHIPEVAQKYIQFHPLLAHFLWPKLGRQEQICLLDRHGKLFSSLLSGFHVQEEEISNKFNAWLQLALPNLLLTAEHALDMKKGKLSEQVTTYQYVLMLNHYLSLFSLTDECSRLTKKLSKLFEQDVGSEGWYASKFDRAGHLLQTKQYKQSAKTYWEILSNLGNEESLERCSVLNGLGCCLKEMGNASEAAACHHQVLAILQKRERSDEIIDFLGQTLHHLGSARRAMGEWEAARDSFKASLSIFINNNNIRKICTCLVELGNIELIQRDLGKAKALYQEALLIVKKLRDTNGEAAILYQLGMVYQKAEQWSLSEEHYRKAAQIEEALGHFQGAAQTWNQLGLITKYLGKIDISEAWFRKALHGAEKCNDRLNIIRPLGNLALILVEHYPKERLNEAKQLAERAVLLSQEIDPDMSQIWIYYSTLADIATLEGDLKTAEHYRTLEKRSQVDISGIFYDPQQYEEFLAGFMSTINDLPEEEKQAKIKMFEEMFESWAEKRGMRPSKEQVLKNIKKSIRIEE